VITAHVEYTTKNIHAYIPRETYAKVKVKLMTQGVSFNEFVTEFAELYASDNPFVQNVVDKIALKKIKTRLKNEQEKAISTEASLLTDHEADTLYALIDSGALDEEAKVDHVL